MELVAIKSEVSEAKINFMGLQSHSRPQIQPFVDHSRAGFKCGSQAKSLTFSQRKIEACRGQRPNLRSLEDDFAVGRVGANALAFAELALKDLQTKWVENLPLDRAL